MAGTSQSASQEVAATKLKIRVRYGRLSVALVGALAVIATVLGVVLAPFTALSFGTVGIFALVAVLSFATLRMLAVRDRNRKLLEHLEATRQKAMQTPAFEDSANQVIARKHEGEEVFDARPGSSRRAPAITAEELRAEAPRVAHGHGGVKRPDTWTPTRVPKPTYVAASERIAKVAQASSETAAQRMPKAPLPAEEPPRPSKQISLKASEDAKRLASEVSAEERAAVTSVAVKREEHAKESAPKEPEAPVAETVPPVTGTLPAADLSVSSTKPRLNLDAVMRRRRA